MDDEKRAKRRASLALAPAILLAAALGIGALYFYPKVWLDLGLSESFGETWDILTTRAWLPGLALVAVWLPLNIAFLRGLYPPRGFLYFAIMLVCQCVLVMSAVILLQPAAARTAAPVRAAWLGAVDAMNGSFAATIDPGVRMPSLPADGQQAALVQEFRGMLSGVGKAANAYRERSAGYVAAYIPGTQGIDLRAVSSGMAKAQSAQWGYEEYLQWILRHGEAAIAARDLPERLQEEMIVRFESGTGAEARRRLGILAIDDRIFATLDAMTKRLGDRNRRWTALPQGPRFAALADQQAFDDARQTLDRLRAWRAAQIADKPSR
ncbi:MAG: hypothetical protein JSR60_08295 [Proteobacteria bacterium]|nr:hypothetical protein [Pseudomonadota bacterium]